MTRDRWLQLLVTTAATAIIIWIANNSYWADERVPMPLKGEAARNPFYAVQHFARQLGAHTEWSRGLNLPPTDGIVLVAAWNWQLTAGRQRRLERWVESGGRLVVDHSLLSVTGEFEHWSGVGRKTAVRPLQSRFFAAPAGRCYTVSQVREPHDSYSICGMEADSSLTTTRVATWALQADEVGTQVARVRLGRGSVTVINGTPFTGLGLLDDDNGALFVAVTQLRRGDEIHFLSEADHSSLLQLAWELGWPVLCLSAALLALALWRSSARFGPLAAPTEIARRSLAEQIRGTGEFAMRVGGGQSLHSAARRALNEVAALYIRAYDRLGASERMRALAEATGFEADTLAAALDYSGPRRSEHLRRAIELLESARRRILLQNARVLTWKSNLTPSPGLPSCSSVFERRSARRSSDSPR